MVFCQVIGCSNDSSRTKGKGYFSIPDPKFNKELCSKWIAALKSEKFSLKTYKYNRNNVVCSDHFEKTCFEKDLRAELCGRKPRKLLKCDAIPSIFPYRERKKRLSTEKRIYKNDKKKLVDSILHPPQPRAKKLSERDGSSSASSTASSTATSTATESAPLQQPKVLPFHHCSRTIPFREAFECSKAAGTSSSKTDQAPNLEQRRVHTSPDLFANPLNVLYPVQPIHETTGKEPDFPAPPAPQRRVLLPLRRTHMPSQAPKKHVSFSNDYLKDHTYSSISSPWCKPSTHSNVDEDVPDVPQPLSPASDTSEHPASSSPELFSNPSSPYSSPSSSDNPSSDIPSSGTRKSDQSYTLSSESSGDSDDDELNQIYSEPKYMVFDSQLEKLLYALKCDKCNGGHVTELKKNVVGTLLSVSAICVCGNTVTRWESQPRIGQMPVGNILCASSAFFSGGTQTTIDFFLSLLKVENVSKSTFYENQKRLVLSATNAAYVENIKKVRREVCSSGEGLTVCGDGRCDSPGYNAKYCSYTFMEMKTSKILAMALVQVTEATSSVAMEKLAFERALDELLDAGCNITTVATDRHAGIRKLLREKYPFIDHQFDVWHMGKSILKKLTAKSKRKECEILSPWTEAIRNHLWYAAVHCKGDEELLVEIWQSMTHHVCNVHSWNSGDQYHECAHAPIDPAKERKIKWLTPDSAPHVALQEVLFDKIFVKDIKHLTKACRTGDLESFHGMLLKYAPKRVEFDYPVMLARLQLAVLDHNNNVGRDSAIVKKPKPGADNKGEEQVACSYSKRGRSWTIKDKKVPKRYDYVRDMQVHILQMQSGSAEVEQVPLPNLPPNIAPVPRPPVEELKAKRYRRY